MGFGRKLEEEVAATENTLDKECFLIHLRSEAVTLHSLSFFM